MVTSRLCPGLDALTVDLERNGAQLYVHAHRVGRFGFLRLNLAVSVSWGLRYRCLAGGGNVQEFFAAAPQTQVVELHLSRESGSEVLCYACSANALPSVVDSALTELAEVDHPADEASYDIFAERLKPR